MKDKSTEQFSLQEIQQKLEYYCAYQERCYKEVEGKLFDFHLTAEEKDQVLIYLIENNLIPNQADHEFPEPSDIQLVFNDLTKKNLYVTDAIKFGGQFLVYEGDPSLFHAKYLVVIA